MSVFYYATSGKEQCKTFCNKVFKKIGIIRFYQILFGKYFLKYTLFREEHVEHGNSQ